MRSLECLLLRRCKWFLVVDLVCFFATNFGLREGCECLVLGIFLCTLIFKNNSGGTRVDKTLRDCSEIT